MQDTQERDGHGRNGRTRSDEESRNSRKEADNMEGTTTIRGTATISLKTLDELRAKAEEAETEKKRSDWFVKKLMNCYGFDTEAYDKALKEIDNKRDLTDKQYSKLVREAMVKHLKIVIDPEKLKELIQEYIDEETSDEHLDIAKASQKELKQIQVVLKE